MENPAEKSQALKDLRRIPGVGKSIALDLWDMGCRSADGMKGLSPRKMYGDLCALKMRRVDRCMLYVFRCAVYFATEEEHDPELLKWWNWKEKEYIS